MRKAFTLMVMGATALSSLASTAAWADSIPTPIANPADGTTLAAMQAQCDFLAGAHDIGNGDVWSGEVVAGTVTIIAGPTEVDGTRVVDESTIVGTGTFTPGTTYIQGDPFRIGGSVNMFGDRYASSGSWSDSTYDFTADFDSTFRHAFSCDIYQAVYNPGDPTAGHYVVHPSEHGNDDASQQACEALNAIGPSHPHWGEPTQQCDFVGTPIPPSLGDPALVGNEDGGYVDQDQTDSLVAHEDHGGPVQADGGPFHIGQAVICISPSGPAKKGVPGVWRQQNGYMGDKCTTDWFVNHAVWGAGTESSNGTYISVPDYSLYN